MEDMNNAECQKEQESPFSALSQSLSSSSSSSSSDSSSSSCGGCSAVPVSCSTVRRILEDHLLANVEEEASLAAAWGLRFVDSEWQKVEERFDRLASTRKSPEPAVKWLDFGFCIGMQQSPEFTNELLRTLRGRRDAKMDITKTQLHSYWCRMTDPCFHSRLRLFFDMCDRNMDGKITKKDIKQIILLSASTNKLTVNHEETEEHAALILQVLDIEGQGYIELRQLETLFKVNLLSKSSISTPQNHNHSDSYYDQDQTKSRPEILFRSHWRRAWIVGFWLVVCFALFAWKFIQYSHRAAFEIMGYCISTAKGAAETLKFNMALILIPVCRNFITWLRHNRWINSAIPFNDNINFHKLIAGGIVIGVILHGGTHLACDFPRISNSDRSIFWQTIAARFGYHQLSYLQILATTEVATGISMVILMAIAFSLATKWPRRQSPSLPRSIRGVTGYNTFWYSHHLFILMYALLIVHSTFLFLTDKLNEKTTWMYIAIPVLLYAGERIFRAIRSRFYKVEILKVSLHRGKVLSLKLCKPEGFNYKSGMCIYIQCPQVSQLEWHPFSLTSEPNDDYLSVHIRTLGDWSCQLYSLFQEAILTGAMKYPSIHIDGPYGAASQDYVKYDTVVLIGLGIGATPFISILKNIANHLENPLFDQVCEDCSIAKGPSKVYYYWVTREQSSFDWFRDEIKEISKANQKQPVIEMHNFLTSVHKEGDARSALISAIQVLYRAKTGIDIISRTPVCTHFARPNWFDIFSRLAQKHRGARIGVFYCGPSGLARELQRLCTKFSTKTATRFVFHKENY